jgi:transposase
MDNRNKKYTRKFKEDAVRLLLAGNKSAGQLGRELGVSGASLDKWKREARRNGDHSLKAESRGSRVHYSILELENLRLKNELEILKKRMNVRIRELLELLIRRSGPAGSGNFVSQEAIPKNLRMSL